MENIFNELYGLNVNEYTEVKDTGKVKLTYLSWSYAVAEIAKRFPDYSYEIVRNEQGLPYFYDENTGYMVFTRVTINGITHEMWLPVMDSNNRAMKSTPYTIKTKYSEINVAAATMFDVNKTIMRCLTKNFAMFGLGLYIYAGEDLPCTETEEVGKDIAKKEPKKEDYMVTEVMIKTLSDKIELKGLSVASVLKKYKVKEIKEMNINQYKEAMELLDKYPDKKAS